MRDGERTAAEYDAMGAAYQHHSDDSPYNAHYERPAMISLVGDVTGRRVLDVGCGPGALSEWLADHGASVIGIDVSPEMIRIASTRLDNRARFIVADATEPLSFLPSASVDLVVASLVLHYVCDWVGVLAEWNRVLAPGGAAVFSTHHPTMDWQLDTPDDYFAVKQVTDSWTLDANEFPVTFWRRPLTAMTEAIAAAGFFIEALVEPQPVASLRERDPATDAVLRRRPWFLFFRLRPRISG